MFVNVIYRFSLLDGKVLANITNTKSFSRCPCCNCPPSMMNKFENFKSSNDFNYNNEAISMGFSSLHLRLRVFGHLLTISTKLHIDKTKSQARGEDKKIANERMLMIKQKFIEKFNMRIEEPRPSGGTSTTGNVTRRAFKNPSLLAEILELDEKMVKNLSNLLAAVSSYYPINIEEFGKLCEETNKIYLEKYGNIFKNVAMHKLLDHGPDIVANSLMPTGKIDSKKYFLGLYKLFK